MPAASLQAPSFEPWLRSTSQYQRQKLQWVSKRWVSSRHKSTRSSPRAGGLSAASRSRMASQRSTNAGVSRRSSSAHRASSDGSSRATSIGIVRAMRNFAGLRFSATSRYQPSRSRSPGSSQTQSWPKALVGRPNMVLPGNSRSGGRRRPRPLVSAPPQPARLPECRHVDADLRRHPNQVRPMLVK